MRTKSISVILALAVWLSVSPGLLFAQQDSIPGVPLHQPQGDTSVPRPPVLDTIITVTTAAGSRAANLPYPEARFFSHERSELPRLPSPARNERFGPPKEDAQRKGPGEMPHERSEQPTAVAQHTNIPTYQQGAAKSHIAYSYDSCIHHRHQLQLTADLTTLQQSKKGAWLKYLPSVSLASGFRASPGSPFGGGGGLSIGLNSSLVYQSHREKQQKKATEEALIKQNQLREATEIAQLYRLQRRLQTEIDKLNLHSGVTDINRQLFTLYQKQYDNHDISPEEYLLKRKAFLLQELRTQDQLNHIQTLQYQIEDLAGCIEIPLDQELFLKKIQPLSRR